MTMKKLIPIFSICLLSTLIIPIEDANADIYKDIAALKKQSKKQKGDIKLLKLRLDKIEQMVKNATPAKRSTANATPKSAEITYP